MTSKELRKKHGITQARLSELVGIPKRTIEDWDAGKKNPPSYVIMLIDFYLTNVEEIMNKKLANMTESDIERILGVWDEATDLTAEEFDRRDYFGKQWNSNRPEIVEMFVNNAFSGCRDEEDTKKVQSVMRHVHDRDDALALARCLIKSTEEAISLYDTVCEQYTMPEDVYPDDIVDIAVIEFSYEIFGKFAPDEEIDKVFKK